MKKQFRSAISFLLAICMIIGSISFLRAEATGSEPDLHDGLLAHYDFENVSGTTVSNRADPGVYNGVLSGSATVVDLQNVAQPGKALQLGSAEGGMQLTDIVNASTSSFSVSLWYKASATSQSNINLVQAGTVGGATGRTILILAPSAKYYTYLTGDNAKTTTSEAVSPLTWQHVTFSYDQSANKAYFYVNGEADRAEGIALSGTPLNVSDMIIGRHRNAGEGQFNGLIDEVRIYNKVLSAEEAAAIYDGSKDAYAAPPVGDITLTVDAGNTLRIIDSDSIFGINHRYAFNGYGSFDASKMEIKEEFRELYEDAGFGSIRYPGGTISNLFNWKTAIGPLDQRKDQIHGFYNNPNQHGIAPNFGLTEIGTFAESVDSEIVYVYSLGRGNAQDAADLIEYLNAAVGTNPNGGIDWAAVRAANGHPEPYHVRYFEIGNEMQQAWAGSDGTASQGYWTTAVSGGSENAYIDGGTAVFTKQYAVCEEDWNEVASRSDGTANQVRYMRYANVNPRKYDENGNVVMDPEFKAVNDGVSVFVGSTQWTVVADLNSSGAADKHVVVDYSTGAIRFGDGVHGAIPASGEQIYVSYSVDREGFVDVSQAMKDTVAAINRKEGTNHELYVYSSYETQGFINKMAERNADHLYDGLTIHPYSGTPSGSGADFYDSAMSLAESVGVQRVQGFVDMMPAGKVPVISEYGIFRSTDPLVRSQTHAIYIAKVLMEYVRLGSPYIQKHCLVDWYSSGADSLGPTQQAVIQAVPGSDANTVTGEGTFTFFSTPSAHVFKMLNSGFGDRVISTEFSAVPTMSNGAKTLSALASKDKDGTVYLAIVNASREEDYKLTLDLKNIRLEGAAVTAQVLTAESFDAQNSPEDPHNVTVVTKDVSFDTDNVTYTVPRHTFVILKIDPVDTVEERDVIVGVGQTKTVIDKTDDFTDSVDKSGLDESIASVTVRGVTTEASRQLSEKVTTLVSGRQYLIFNTRSQKPVTNAPATAAAQAGAGSGLNLNGTKDNIADAAVWTLTKTANGYTLQDASGKYMTIGANSAGLTNNAAELTVAYNGTTWTISQNGAYLNHFGGQNSTCAAGWQDTSAAGDPGSQWEIYEVVTTPGVRATEISITGITAGETSVRVGNTVYHITVSTENVSTVTLDHNYSGAEDDSITVFTGAAIGELPVPMRPGHTFFGWYLDGTQVTSDYVVNEDITLVADWVSVSTKDKPANGTTTGQPFPVNDANGNAYCYRIPGIVTLDNGTVIAMADHRWNTWADCGGLDTIVSVSADNGRNWTYTFANYLGDNGDTYNPWSTTFIDPAIATNGTTAYMIADLFPAGVSTMANGYASQAGHSGFDAKGRLVLRDLIGDTYKVGAPGNQYIPMATSRSYDYYLNPESDGSYTIRKSADDSMVEGYSVDAFFNIRSADGTVNTHLFKADSPYQVYPTNYLYMNTSTDGLTWSAPKLLNLKSSTESAFLVGPGSGTYDPHTGCMVFTAYSYNGSAGSQRSCLIWMDGEGNWTRSEPATNSEWSSEASAVVLADGTVRVFFRDQNTLLSYTDYKWVDGAYDRDENNVRVTTAAAKNGGNGCMLSALRYSQPVNGKEAVMVATPATSNSRSDGHIYVFLVNEDGTMELAYDHDITDGAEYYAYSCLTELKKGQEAGSLALFWEDSWRSSPAAATIHYSVIPVEQVTSRENDMLHTYTDVVLNIGGTATYTDNTGDYSKADTSALDTDVATVDMTVRTEAQNTVRTLGSNTNMDIADCLFAFTASGDYYVISRRLENGTTVYLNHFGTSHNNIPLTESSNVVAVTNGSFDGMFQLQSQTISGVSGLARTLHFHMESGTPYWNRCGGDTSEKCHEYLFRPANQGEDTTGSQIPGYVQLTDVSQIVSGGQYLIAARNDAGNWYVLNPVIPANHLECVAKVMGQSNVSSTEITFTGVGEGRTSLQIGNVIYNIRVTAGVSQDGHNYVNGFCVDEGCGAYQPAVLKNGVYEISNGGQLYWFAALVNGDTDAVPGIVRNSDADAVLTCDITVNDAVVNNGVPVENPSGLRTWVPIGRFIKYNNFVSYTGTFDGNDHTVSGLYVSDAAGERVALFGVVSDGAMIRNLGLKDTYFSAKQYVAGIVAEGYSSSADAPITIVNCWTENTVIEADVYYSGGIAGHVLRFAEIADCRNEASVEGGSNVGGIIGYCGDGTNVIGCSNEGAISGTAAVGGIAGANNGGNFTKALSRCFNTGSISGVSEVGGIVGQNSSTVEDCYNLGDVTGTGSHAGGIVGYNLNADAKVKDCHNMDDIAAPIIGGSSNTSEDAVENCFYLADSEKDENNGTTAKSAEAFASGEITWLLNHETDEGELVWFQTIGADMYPKFAGKIIHKDGENYYNDDAPAAGEVIRLAGEHRWNTAIKVADEMKANLGVEKFDAIIVASGNDFADALAGSYLSTVKNAPILLAWGQGGAFEYLDTDNINYIKENLSEDGVVYILGGEKAVPALYETELATYEVKRLGGADRFETNILILEEAGIPAGSEVLVCTSTNFADSLSASATAKPILLAFNEFGALFGKQPEFLAKLEDCTFTVIGGENAVGAKLVTAIEAYGEVTRLAGANRFETSVLVAEKYFEAPETAVLAYAWNYPDGLCGGSLAYSLGAPLILTMTGFEDEAVAYAESVGITAGVVLGGDGLISDEAVRAIFAMDAEDEIILKK